MEIDRYFERHPASLHIFRWAHARQYLSTPSEHRGLCASLLALRAREAPQILYANTEAITDDSAFPVLCDLLRAGKTWAVNLGEARFSSLQCAELHRTILNSQVAFMYVERNFVGQDTVRLLKDAIRDRRRSIKAGEPAPWLLSHDLSLIHI